MSKRKRTQPNLNNLQGELKDAQKQNKKFFRETGKIIDNTRLPADERKRKREIEKEGRKKGDPNARRNGSDGKVANS